MSSQVGSNVELSLNESHLFSQVRLGDKLVTVLHLVPSMKVTCSHR